MAELFSEEWMTRYMDEWNKEPELSDALARISFNSNIAYGFIEDDKPKGVLVVENGKVSKGGLYNGEELNWDLRASRENWEKFKKGMGMAGLGMAYMGGKLKFKIGDYTAMIKDPRMASPFVKSFTVMGRVDEDV
jgi:putative sterol carrier protein